LILVCRNERKRVLEDFETRTAEYTISEVEKNALESSEEINSQFVYSLSRLSKAVQTNEYNHISYESGSF
jgi:hypothetical protein